MEINDLILREEIRRNFKNKVIGSLICFFSCFFAFAFVLVLFLLDWDKRIIMALVLLSFSASFSYWFFVWLKKARTKHRELYYILDSCKSLEGTEDYVPHLKMRELVVFFEEGKEKIYPFRKIISNLQKSA